MTSINESPAPLDDNALDALAIALLADDSDYLTLFDAIRPLLTIDARDYLADALDICPIHICDIAICLDDDPADCRDFRS